jgi:hypothetical protein
MAASSPEQSQRRGVDAAESVIELTEEEEKIFRQLLDVVRHLGLSTKLRVAGGWVRDKVLASIFSFRFPFSSSCSSDT